MSDGETVPIPPIVLLTVEEVAAARATVDASVIVAVMNAAKSAAQVRRLAALEKVEDVAVLPGPTPRAQELAAKAPPSTSVPVIQRLVAKGAREVHVVKAKDGWIVCDASSGRVYGTRQPKRAVECLKRVTYMRRGLRVVGAEVLAASLPLPSETKELDAIVALAAKYDDVNVEVVHAERESTEVLRRALPTVFAAALAACRASKSAATCRTCRSFGPCDRPWKAE